jgi:hypothetical protein
MEILNHAFLTVKNFINMYKVKLLLILGIYVEAKEKNEQFV